MLFQHVARILVSISLLGLMSCQKSENNRQANTDIAESFRISVVAKPLDTNVDLSNDKAEIRIKKSALEKEFLLRINAISQDVVPMFTGGQSRVIYFKRAGDNLVAFESSRGFSTDVESPTARIIAVFPVTAENEDDIVFDFNKGMSTLFMVNWTETNENKVELGYNLVPAESSFIADASFDKNRLVISQWARLSVPEAGSDEDEEPGKESEPNIVFKTVEFKYFLSPYTKSPSFTPSVYRNLNWFGYFTGPTLLDENGQKITYSTKFDDTKKIVFALSANTPDELKPVFTEAILYWNKAFGRKVVEVIVLTDKEIRAPHPDYNIIQWVDFQEAAFAYADMQSDPLTGEILNVQVFMPSGFYIHGKNEADRMIREYTSLAPKARFAVKGFEPLNHCFKSFEPLSQELSAAIEKGELSDEKIKLISSNYLASTVAHEVGHTLGLRHNFAGSLAASYKAPELPALMKSYIENSKVPAGTVVSSTVMDYTLSEEDIMMGHQVRDSHEPALSYDLAAIQNLYGDEEVDINSAPAFCTDEHHAKFVDCWQFDGGNSSLDAFIYNFQMALKNAPRRVLNYYISEKQKGHEVIDIAYDQKAWVKKVLTAKMQLGMFLSPKNFMRSISKKYNFIPGYEGLVRQDSLNKTQAMIEELGGLEKIYPDLTFNFPSQAYQEFEKILTAEAKGSRLGKEYSFSKEEQDLMKTQVKALFRSLYLSLVNADLAAAKTVTLVDHEVVDALAEINLKNALYFAFSKASKTKTETLVSVDGVTSNVEVPQYLFGRGIRAGALGLLSLKGRPGWGVVEREELKNAIKTELAILGGLAPDKIDWKKTSMGLRHWYFEQMEIFQGAGYAL